MAIHMIYSLGKKERGALYHSLVSFFGPAMAKQYPEQDDDTEVANGIIRTQGLKTEMGLCGINKEASLRLDAFMAGWRGGANHEYGRQT